MEIRKEIWAEGARMATMMDNITVNHKTEKTLYELFYKKKPNKIMGYLVTLESSKTLWKSTIAFFGTFTRKS